MAPLIIPVATWGHFSNTSLVKITWKTEIDSYSDAAFILITTIRRAKADIATEHCVGRKRRATSVSFVLFYASSSVAIRFNPEIAKFIEWYIKRDKFRISSEYSLRLGDSKSEFVSERFHIPASCRVSGRVHEWDTVIRKTTFSNRGRGRCDVINNSGKISIHSSSFNISNHLTRGSMVRK